MTLEHVEIESSDCHGNYELDKQVGYERGWDAGYDRCADEIGGEVQASYDEGYSDALFAVIELLIGNNRALNDANTYEALVRN